MKKRKVKRGANPEPVKLNFRLIGAISIVLFSVYLSFNPTALNKTLNRVFDTTCDYNLMLSDISSVIKRHTVGGKVFKMPVKGEITSPFGKRISPDGKNEETHTGMDINAQEGTQVLSSYKGTVSRVEENEFYGKFIMIEHGKSLFSLYGHLSEQMVEVGDEVNESTVIGLSGNSGRSTGPHLHFEIRKNGECVNPEDYIL